MKSNRGNLLTGPDLTLTLLTACTQASSQSALQKQYCTNTSTSKNQNKQFNYFTDKDKDSSYDESKASTVKLSGFVCNCFRGWR